MKRIGIGLSDFKELIEEDFYYFDKTKFIDEIVKDGAKVKLFTRPRRFGKTLNMSMLKYFFDVEKKEENRKLFKDLYIEKTESFKEQGQYPVIFLSLKDLKTAEYQDLVNQGGVTVVDFWAPWCGYCVRMMPIIEEIAGELEGKANFVKVNADEEPELAHNLQVEVLPTFVILKDGEVVDRKIGFLPKGDLQAAIESKF